MDNKLGINQASAASQSRSSNSTGSSQPSSNRNAASPAPVLKRSKSDTDISDISTPAPRPLKAARLATEDHQKEWAASCALGSDTLDLSEKYCALSLDPLLKIASEETKPFFVIARTSSSSTSHRTYHHYYAAESFIPSFTKASTPEILSREKIQRVDYFVLFRGETVADWFGDYQKNRNSSQPELQILVKAITANSAYDRMLNINAMGKIYSAGTQALGLDRHSAWFAASGRPIKASPVKAAMIQEYVTSTIRREYLNHFRDMQVKTTAAPPATSFLFENLSFDNYMNAIDLHSCNLLSNQMESLKTQIRESRTTVSDGNILNTPHLRQFAVGLALYHHSSVSTAIEDSERIDNSEQQKKRAHPSGS